MARRNNAFVDPAALLWFLLCPCFIPDAIWAEFLKFLRGTTEREVTGDGRTSDESHHQQTPPSLALLGAANMETHLESLVAPAVLVFWALRTLDDATCPLADECEYAIKVRMYTRACREAAGRLKLLRRELSE